MTRTKFEAQLKELSPGQAIAYHTGDLEQDRRMGIDFLSVENTARAAWEAMLAGRVHLVQQRLGFRRYIYGAVLRPKPYEKVVFRGCYNDEPLIGAQPKKSFVEITAAVTGGSHVQRAEPVLA